MQENQTLVYWKVSESRPFHSPPGQRSEDKPSFVASFKSFHFQAFWISIGLSRDSIIQRLMFLLFWSKVLIINNFLSLIIWLIIISKLLFPVWSDEAVVFRGVDVNLWNLLWLLQGSGSPAGPGPLPLGGRAAAPWGKRERDTEK